MPRRFYTLMDDGCYHIICRGNNRSTVFRDDSDRQCYLHLLAGYFGEYRVTLYHYCLMSNHVHLVVRARHGQDVGRAMHDLNLTYAQHLQRAYDHVGHVWQGPFRNVPITADAHLLQCGAYVELNPVRAGIVQAPQAYPWSSYRAYAEGLRDPFVIPDPAYLGLAETPARRQHSYRDFVMRQLALPQAAVSHLLPSCRGRPQKKHQVQKTPGSFLSVGRV